MSSGKTRGRRPQRPRHTTSFDLLEERCLLSSDPLGLVDQLKIAPTRPTAIAAVTATNTAPVCSPSICVQSLQPLKVNAFTGWKPQSKVWTYDGRWWTALSDRTGTWIWRLDGQQWTQVLKLDIGQYLADVKPIGDVAHILLFKGAQSKLASVQYVPGPGGAAGTYRFWSPRPTLASVPLGLKTAMTNQSATIDMDSKGRLWVAWDQGTSINVMHSEFPYATWSIPTTVISGLALNDISVVTALPGGQIGVLWSNQVAGRFGFRVRNDNAAPDDLGAWSDDEVPGSESAANDGLGLADNHLNVAVASDGTLYAVVKTNFSSPGFPRFGLLVRRPNGIWDRMYTVLSASQLHTRPIVVLNEAQGRLLVFHDVYTNSEMFYQESATSQIAFGSPKLLMRGANVTSTKQNWTTEVVAIASGNAVLISTGLKTDAGPDQNVVFPGAASLHGTVTKTGQSVAPGLVTTTWTKLSGPGDVTFSNASAVDTTARFSVPGKYVLRLTADDGKVPAKDEITITAATSGSVAFQDAVFPTPTYAGTQDTFITPSAPAKGKKPPVVKINGSAATLLANGLVDNASLVKWDLSNVPAGTKLKSAAITLNITKASTQPYKIYELKRDWAEDQATWDGFTAVDNWGTPGAQGPSDRGSTVLGTVSSSAIGPKATGLGLLTVTLNADGLAVVQSWINNPSLNHGFIVQEYSNLNNKEIDFSSREATTPANRPKLTLTYEANLAPVLAPIGDKSIKAGEPLSFAISATDGNQDPITFSASGLPAGATFDPGTRTFNWAPARDQQGTSRVTFSVSDGSATVSETISITSGAPLLPSIGAKSVNELDLLSFQVPASDLDGDPITLSTSGLPTGATFNPDTRTFNWTPAENQDGTTTVTFSVSDGFNTVSEAVPITVRELNQPPVMAIDTKSVNEGSPLSFKIAATDPDVVNGSSNTLTYAGVSLPSGATFDAGTLTFNWTPSENQDGPQTATFSVSDGTATVLDTVTIRVAEVNRAPVLAPLSDLSVEEDQLMTFTLSASDPDLVDGLANRLTFSGRNLPAGATLDPSTGIFSWRTPNEDGTFQPTFTVSDGLTTDSKTIKIALGVPVMSPIGPKSVNERSLLQFTVSAQDSPDEPITYSASGLPTGASLNSNTGAFSWTPAENQDGNYSVTFSANDGFITVSEKVLITIAEVNQAPVLAPIGPKPINEGSLLSFLLSATDSDLVGGAANTLSFSATGLPNGATLNPTTGAFKWTPSESQDGTANVTFKVSDGTTTTSETVTVTVAEVSQPPVLSAIGAKSINEGSALNFTVVGTDADLVNGQPDTLTFSADGLLTGATFDAGARSFNWTPTESQDGTYTVTFRLSDGTSSVSEAVTITVREVNSAPVLASIGSKSMNEGSLLSFAVSATDSDIVNGVPNTLTFSANGAPGGANFDAANRTFAWTPAENQDGSYNVTFRVTDSTTPISETITISVAEVNQAPVLAPIGDRSVNVGGTLSFTVSATDADVVAGIPNALSYSVVGLPFGATLDTNSHVFTWTPAADQAGSYLVKFRVSDGKTLTFETISISVNQPAVGAFIASRDHAVDQALEAVPHGSARASLMLFQSLLEELTAELAG